MVGFSNRRLAKSAFGLVAAAALVGALALTPAGSLAQSFITIFEPTQFVAVPVAQSDVTSLQSLPNLQSFGTMTQLAQPATRQVAGASEAARTSGLTLRTPTWLPASVPSSVSYAVMTQGTASFTFSAAKASAAVTATGQRLPAMPAGLDGSTLQLTVGPAVVATYGGSVAPSSGATAGSSATSRSRLPTGSAVRPRIKRIGIKGLLTGRTAVAAAQHQGEIPALAILEAPQPRVTSTGASVADIENYLLAMPGVSPQLAAEIRSIGDPTTTLPVPIPIDRAIAQTVQIHGADGQDASGLLVGDNTGLGSGVVWESDGMVYAVAGSLPQDQIIRIAESLR